MATTQAVATKAEPAQTPVPAAQRVSLVRKFAAAYSIEDSKLLATLKATAFRQSKKDGATIEVSDEQMAALLVVADVYHLNPFTREIYAFPDKGGIVPIVSVDGWIRIINERPELKSIEFQYSPDDDTENPWVGCMIVRNDRTAPISIREYFKECYRDTGPWNSHPRRMLRHKALIQCARIAFGFGGIYDPDEAERIRDANAIDSVVVSGKAGTTAPKAIDVKAASESSEPAAAQADTCKVLRDRLEHYSVAESALLAKFEIGKLEDLPFESVNVAYDWIPQAARDA